MSADVSSVNTGKIASETLPQLLLVYDEHGKKKWIVFECESVGHVQTVIQY
jgi:hypothetical protein